MEVAAECEDYPQASGDMGSTPMKLRNYPHVPLKPTGLDSKNKKKSNQISQLWLFPRKGGGIITVHPRMMGSMGSSSQSRISLILWLNHCIYLDFRCCRSCLSWIIWLHIPFILDFVAADCIHLRFSGWSIHTEMNLWEQSGWVEVGWGWSGLGLGVRLWVCVCVSQGKVAGAGWWRPVGHPQTHLLTHRVSPWRFSFFLPPSISARAGES